jgi:superfamily II DNA or RNA helicase
MQVSILNQVYGRVSSRSEVDLIKPCLKYSVEKWSTGAFGEKEKTRVDHFMIESSGKFLIGLLPRIKRYCKIQDIDLICPKYESFIPCQCEPVLPGIEFRIDQERILKTVPVIQRGYIKSPTGSGKTVLAGGIFSMYPKSNRLFLCHTLDLLTQTFDEFNNWKLGNIKMLGGGSSMKQISKQEKSAIVVSTIQTFKNAPQEIIDLFDIILIDECQHVTDTGRGAGIFIDILKKSRAFVKIGLTATPPDKPKDILVLEGYLGEMIGEFTLKEGIESGVLAQPVIDLQYIPYSEKLADLTKWKEVYQQAIVNNKIRNYLILEQAISAVEKNESVLILIGREKEHGKILRNMAADIFDADIPFVYGEIKKEERKSVKGRLSSKEIKCVIANVVWHEGLNIPSVDVIINADGGKSSRVTLQKVGRGLRTAKDKHIVRIIDFLDPYKYLSHHCVMRLNTYAKEGWLKPIVNINVVPKK